MFESICLIPSNTLSRKKLGVTLWEREGRSLRLTQGGELLLQVAQQLLPVLSQTEKTLRAYGEGLQGTLHIGVECYPCYQWLTGVIGEFMQQMPDVDIDIVNKFQFSGLEGLLNHHVDILVTPDFVKKEKIHYEILTAYELVILLSVEHPLAELDYFMPEHLANETLLTFPVPLERLDIYSCFMTPSHISPARHKAIESLEIMLEMTALNRGICVLPTWLANDKCKTLKLKKMSIGQGGMHKKLFLAMRDSDKSINYIEKFIAVGKKTAIQKGMR
ncbi:MAG: LysR substrate-binding domain-containing protein [Methylococcaceae bacterium]